MKGYTWAQTEEDIELTIPLADGLTAKTVKVQFEEVSSAAAKRMSDIADVQIQLRTAASVHDLAGNMQQQQQ